MAFNFGFFGAQQRRTFNYKPRYYDPKKELLEKKCEKGEGEATRKDDHYVPGTYLRGKMSKNDSYKSVGKIQNILGAVSLILFFITMIYVVKIFATLWN